MAVCTSDGLDGADRSVVAGDSAAEERLAELNTPVVNDRRPVLEQLREMAAASEGSQSQLRETFFYDQRKLFRFLAHRLCRTMGLATALHRDDVEQLVALEAVAWVDELLVNPAAIDVIESFEGLLHVRSRSSVRTWADRILSPASGMVSLNRRVRKLNQLRDELRAATGTEPTDGELAREHNERMLATRKDAAKQGMLVTAEDLRVARPAVDIEDLELAVSETEDGLLHPTEGPAVVRAVIERARSIGGVTSDVAQAWLSGVYESEGAQRVLTTREVAGQLGLTQESAAAQIRKVRALAKRILADQLGIHDA